MLLTLPTQPWYLSTFAVAEQLYDALIVWEDKLEITVTPTSLAFFRQFIPNLTTGLYTAATPTYATLIRSIKEFADGFVLVNAKYTPSDGSLAEQYNRDAGYPLSAKDLTWSYASALTAFAARDGYRPASWGAKKLTVPSVCGTNPGPTASVTFNIKATTEWGGKRKFFYCSNDFLPTICTEFVYLVGSLPGLGGWLPETAIPLSSANYPVWSGECLN